MGLLSPRPAAAVWPPQGRSLSQGGVTSPRIPEQDPLPSDLPWGPPHGAGQGCRQGGPGGGGPWLLQPQGPHPLTRPWGLRGKYLRVTLREDADDRGDRSRAPCTDSSPVATRIGPWRSACPWSMVTGGPGWGPRVISPPHTFLLSGGRPRLRHGAAGAGGGRTAELRLPYSLDQRAVLPECLLQDHGQGAWDMAARGVYSFARR